MINFDKFWDESGEHDDDYAAYGRDPEPPQPGVTANEIQTWEQTHGVALPQALREALVRQNGGVVRYSSVRIQSLANIKPASEEFWTYACYPEDEIPDRRLVFEFADQEERGGQYLLNFNARGPRGEPSIYLFFSDPGDLDEDSDSLTSFFADLLDVTEEAQVDWAETERPGVTVLARETIDVSPVFGAGARHEQVLVQDPESLVLYSRLSSKREETLTKLTLPTPLEPNMAAIQPLRPAPISTHSLHIYPTSNDGIVHVESTRASDGSWKTSTTRGAPVYGYFESTDQTKLRALRAQLLGAEADEQARKREESQALFEQHMNSLSPEARRAAMFEAVNRAREEIDRRFTAQFGSTEPPPGEIADLAKLVQDRMADVLGRAQADAVKNPPSPRTMYHIINMLKHAVPGYKPPKER
jgi:SMI1 / KNR4 family (SUKH-1)